MDESATNSEACSDKKKRGGRYCVAGAPKNLSCKNNSHTVGISMHQFPKDPVVQRKWVKFVQRHRANFHESSVTKYTSLCSAHFEESCYTRKISLDLGEHSKQNKVLIRGSILTRDSVVPERTDILTGRKKRQVSDELNVRLINSYFLVLIRKFFYSVNRVVSLLG